jgi:hypothetical protein
MGGTAGRLDAAWHRATPARPPHVQAHRQASPPAAGASEHAPALLTGQKRSAQRAIERAVDASQSSGSPACARPTHAARASGDPAILYLKTTPAAAVSSPFGRLPSLEDRALTP